jgi:hypothetical protein
MRGCVLDSSGSELGPLMDSYEQGIKFSGCVTKDWEYLELSAIKDDVCPIR